MRWLALLVLVACAARPSERIFPPLPGALAQVEAAPDLDGRPIGAQADARATIVIVLASWCGHCHDEIAVIDKLRAAHPHLRVVGVNYKEHEEYDHRGSPAAIRAYSTAHAWLRIAPADQTLFDALGAPPMIPAMFVYGHDGALAAHYDRRGGAMPDAAELAAVLSRLGA